jgi:hypothetical protein
VSEDFLAAVRDGQVESFLADHAGLIDAEH